MRDNMPLRPRKNECGIINLDQSDGIGTHWVAYKKNVNSVVYFDSFGNLQPPKEFVDYMGSRNRIFFNHDKYQDFNSFNCGHLCLMFLVEMNKL